MVARDSDGREETYPSGSSSSSIGIRALGSMRVVEIRHPVAVSSLAASCDLKPGSLLIWTPEPIMPCATSREEFQGGSLIDVGASAADIILDAGLVVAPSRATSARIRRARIPEKLPASTVFDAAMRLVRGASRQSGPPIMVRDALVERAISELLAASFGGLSRDANELAARREAGLLERLIAFVDRDPSHAGSVAEICAELGCSRSALYRAAAPMGGVQAIVTEITSRVLTDAPEIEAEVAAPCGSRP